MRFGLDFLLIMVCLGTALLGIIAQGSFVAFVIGFAAFGVLLMRLMFRQRSGPVIVRETGSDAEAYGLKSFLREHGIVAEVEPASGQPVADNSRPPRVLVPPEQAGEALELLERLRQDETEASSSEDVPSG